ncbi:unnamed protein product [Angiostrongylus costaricensis]|uniref:Doublecortin domain-containing protein n=1 Tax=Angiostrongylus costaricensis TaxID=334426 RepID=A0A158PGE6_ANGCS|nr:unnamed protein product [Angiostrongylus costaricensis]
MQSVKPQGPLKPRRVSPANSSKPEGAWQEEESLEIYKRKTTQRPPSDDSKEIIRLVKRHPRRQIESADVHEKKSTDQRRTVALVKLVVRYPSKHLDITEHGWMESITSIKGRWELCAVLRSGEELFETVSPRRDSPREIILLEPVQFREHSPDSLYDDYTLYRMEEYVDASSDICSKGKEPVYYTVEKTKKDVCPKEKEPVYYTVEKSTKHEKRTEEQDVIVEECLSPAKEIETTSLTKYQFEEQSDLAERLSTKSHPIARPTPFEVCSYRPPLPPIADTISEEVEIERTSDVERSERACSQCGKDEKGQTPLLDRTVYYEREIVGRTPEDSHVPTRQTYFVDEDIIDTNKKVDSVLRGRETKESSRLSIPDLVEKRREERSSVEEYRRIQKEKSEFTESPKATSERREAPHFRESPVRTSRDTDYITDFEKYEKATYGPPSRSVSMTRSSRTASNHSPRCQHRKISREHEESLRQERRTIRDVPIRREMRYPPYYREVPLQKPRSENGRSSCDGRYVTHPIHEVITTEKFERVERIRRRFPGTLV